MKRLVRCPLVSIAALGVYLAVQVFAGVLHHHGAEHRSEALPATGDVKLHYQPASLAESDEEETCLLCSALHLAQIPAATFHVQVIIEVHGEAHSAASIIRPHPLEKTTCSRGPPLV